MTQKQLTVALLEKLKPYRDMAGALSELMQTLEDEKAGQELVSGILRMLTEVNTAAESKLSEEKKQKAVTYLEKIHDVEDSEKGGIDQELNDLLASI